MSGSAAARYKCPARGSSSRQRPHHAGSTGSLPHTEVKQRWVRIVLRWVTAWEHRMPLASFCLRAAARPDQSQSPAEPSPAYVPARQRQSPAKHSPAPARTRPSPDPIFSQVRPPTARSGPPMTKSGHGKPESTRPGPPATKSGHQQPDPAQPGPAPPNSEHPPCDQASRPASGPGRGLIPPENTKMCPARALRAHSSRSLSTH